MADKAMGRERWVVCVAESHFPVRRSWTKAVLTTCRVRVGVLRESIAPDRVREAAICGSVILKRSLAA